MPGLVDRASLIAKAKASKLLDRAENPEETLDYSYEQQLVQLQNVKRGIADVATAKQRLQMQAASMQEQVTKLDGQAREALQTGPSPFPRRNVVETLPMGSTSGVRCVVRCVATKARRGRRSA